MSIKLFTFVEKMELLEELETLVESGLSYDEIAEEYDIPSGDLVKSMIKEFTKLRNNPPKGVENEDFTRDALKGSVRYGDNVRKRYLVTSAIPLAKTFQNAVKSLLNAAEHLDARLIALTGRSHNRPLKKQVYHYDPWLKDFVNSGRIKMMSEAQFNSSIRAIDLEINPQQLNPLTGIAGINWDRGLSSVLIASPQMSLITTPRGNSKSPRIIAGTGTISRPTYLEDTRIGVMAHQNHECGAVLIEVEDEKIFHIRHLEIDGETGEFYDIANGECNKYTPDGVYSSRAIGWILGDKHVGYLDQVIEASQARLANILNPMYHALHDVIDASSVSHHTANKMYVKLKAPFQSLQEELKAVRNYLYSLANSMPDSNGIIVASNHHDHVYRYLEEDKYFKDIINYEIGHRMKVNMMDGIDPVQSRCDPENRYQWLSSLEDFDIAGVNVAMHGHKGPNGARGSIKNIAQIVHSGIIAHSHSPCRYRNILQIGHSSKERHGYNSGPSGWIPADGVIYENGSKQLIMHINGKSHM